VEEAMGRREENKPYISRIIHVFTVVYEYDTVADVIWGVPPSRDFTLPLCLAKL
jgi:hypothetical protein